MTIAAVEELHEEFGDDFCGIVVCGGGLKDQWREQISAFTGGTEDDDGHWSGGAPCIVIDGTPEKRMKLYKRVLAEKPRYVVLGYDQVVDDHNMVSQLPQMYVVADEVTTIKNPQALITQAFRETFGDAPFRFGLTGTPMENGKPEEMFQLMVWIDDSVLGRADLFDKTFCRRNRYGTVIEYINLPLFYELMQECSVSLDADDPDVAPYMPTMSRPTRVLVEFDEESAAVYNMMAEDLLEELAEAAKKSRGGFDLFAHYAGDSDAGETQGRIMSKISCMRMLCAHPDQIIHSAQEYIAGANAQVEMDKAADAHVARYGEHDAKGCPIDDHPTGWPKVTKTIGGKKVKVPKPLPGSAYAAELYTAGELDGLDEAPKVDEICLDIDDMLAGQCKCCRDLDGAEHTNKVVVFSYHKLVLRILEARYPGICVRYDGDMTLKKRNENKKLFQRDPAIRLFLTSDAGGYGVDLPQANHLLNLDKPFTAGRVIQRNARVRRANLDYHQSVHVRDYLIDGSLEIYYADITEAKGKVATAVRTGKGATRGVIKVTADTLGQFLATHTV